MIAANFPGFQRKELESVLDALVNGNIDEGKITSEFEKTVAEYFNRKYAIATPNVFSSFHLAFLALNLNENDKILVPGYIESRFLQSIFHLKLIPKFYDISLPYYSGTVENIKPLVDEKTRAIVIVHNFGIPVPVSQFFEFDKPVIEFLFHSIGATYISGKTGKEVRAGSEGTITILSFEPDEIITTGIGSMILTDSRDIANRIKNLKKGEDRTTFDYRISDVLSAIGISQFKSLEKILARRKKLAEIYNQKLKKGIKNKITAGAQYKRVYGKYVIEIDRSVEKFINRMWKRKKIGITRPVKNPLFLLFDNINLSVSQKLYRRLIALPLYPHLTEKEVEKVVKSFLEEINSI